MITSKTAIEDLMYELFRRAMSVAIDRNRINEVGAPGSAKPRVRAVTGEPRTTGERQEVNRLDGPGQRKLGSDGLKTTLARVGDD
jgi:hypothetical protein